MKKLGISGLLGSCLVFTLAFGAPQVFSDDTKQSDHLIGPRLDSTVDIDVPGPQSVGDNYEENFNSVGDASAQNPKYENVHIITDNTPNKVQANWAKQKIDLKKEYSMQFQVLMKNNPEGLTFAMHRDDRGNEAIGHGKSSLGVYGNHNTGYQGGERVSLARGVAVEFDNQLNSGGGDSIDYFSQRDSKLTGPHISMSRTQWNTDISTVAFFPSDYSLHPFRQTSFNLKLNDGQWHSVEVQWRNVKWGEFVSQYHGLFVFVDGKLISSYSPAYDNALTNGIFQGGEPGLDAYWGFTGASGNDDGVTAVAIGHLKNLEAKLDYTVKNISAGESEFKPRTNAHKNDHLMLKLHLTGFNVIWDGVKVKAVLPEGLETVDGKKELLFEPGTIKEGQEFTEEVEVKVTVNKTTEIKAVAQATGANWYEQIPLYSDDLIVNVEKTTFVNPLDLSISGQHFNNTYTEGHDAKNTHLDEVVTGDDITAKFVIKNSKELAQLSNGVLAFNLVPNSKVQYVDVDGTTVKYTASNNSDGTLVKTDPVINIDGVGERVITINYKVGDNKGKPFKNWTEKATLTGKSPVDPTDVKEESNALSMSAATGDIEFQPHNIDFGPYASFEKDDVLKRLAENNDPNPIVDITDKRRNPENIKLTVKQELPFKLAGAGEPVYLPSKLRYYSAPNDFKTLETGAAANEVTIAEAKKDEHLKPVIWQENNGLLLYANGNNFKAGDYSTQLLWTVVSGY